MTISAIFSRLRPLQLAVWKWTFPKDFPPPNPKRKAGGPPSHLRTYLDYYRKLDAPGYAVMVTGDWGVGKTHQVEQSLDEGEYVYVSLYGLRTSEELRSAVFAQLFPTRHKINGFINDAKQAMRDASGLFSIGSLTPGLFGAFFDQGVSKERILVFDDLERSRIPPRVLLGVINQYVEHSGCRAIVIVHDRKIVDPYFEDSKEKLFGQTIEALPQIDEAFASFVKTHRGTKFGEFLAPFEKDVVDIFKKSGAKSLRLLKYLVEDLRRLHDVLQDKHLAHGSAIVEIVAMLSVLSIEFRDGNILPPDLLNRQKSIGEAGSKLAIIASKFQSVDLASTTMQDHLLEEILVRGIYNSDNLFSSLEASHHFLIPQKEPAWKTVINFDKLDDDKVEFALERMNRQVDELESIEPGEMLHILALRLMMAEQGISGDTPAKSVDTAKSYIDSMLNAGKLTPRPLLYDPYYGHSTSHEGIGYWVSKPMEPFFKQITDHLDIARTEAQRRSLEKELPTVLKLLADGEKFFEQFVQTFKGGNRYAQVGMLDMIEPRDFVAAWLRSPKKGWYWIGSAINERYKNSHHLGELKREREWAREVVRLLVEEASKLQGFAQFRLLRAIPSAVGNDEAVIETVAHLESGDAVEAPLGENSTLEPAGA